MPMQVKGIRELMDSLGVMPDEMRAALKPAVKDAGDVIGEQMKENASFSSWIPGAVKVSSSFSARGGGARITVAERGYPHAGEVRTFEGNGDSPTQFRHPVYGNRNAWVAAMTHPFAGPAVVDKEPEAVARIAEAVQSVMAANGL